ncbi:hypothetical protein CASFOL_013161 [Castilleja foliolosa]|uniref:RING-type domain-containing protein n=1 Tax=Castilleja foliolosa TaxID=1961234 RepID=A0ABD3DL26_9LAMI
MRAKKMLGGGGNNGNTTIPGFVEENRVQYDSNSMPQFRLFGHVPIQCGAGVSTMNYIGNRQAPNNDNKGVRESETLSMQRKLHISLNNKNLCHDEAGRTGIVVNPNTVSTGLKLSCEEEERNSSVTSACENMKNSVPVLPSLGNTIKMEMDRQTEEFGRYIKLQEENISRGVREINQMHTISMLTTLEKGVNRKLHEKELQIENFNRKNDELVDKIKQVAAEAQSWHYRAKYNESVVNVLKNNIQQLMEQNTALAHEGSGDSSELDDTISCSNHPRNQGIESCSMKCRACYDKGVSVLVLPCRHLCLCTDCEGFIDVCPVCRVMKTASVRVYMS